MEELLRFFTKNSPFFTWLFLAILSIVLLCQSNPYQRSILFSSANAVSGSMYDFQSNVTGYFGLREINEDLQIRTGELEAENVRLRQELQNYKDALTIKLDSAKSQYKYTIAHVVYNSINQVENYITIDKGLRDGMMQDLGVTDHNGVVGIIAKVSTNYSLVLSVLNPKMRLSVMLKNSEAFGSLVWDGKDSRYAIMEDLPRNVGFEQGDTIVTTGYTNSFPKNVPVGRIVESYDRGGSFLSLKIELFTDFNRLNDVQVIFDEGLAERLELNKPDEPKKRAKSNNPDSVTTQAPVTK